MLDRALILIAVCAVTTSADDLFVDVTEQAGLLSSAYSLWPDPDDIQQWQWTQGGAVGDFNADGWPDLFILAGPDATDKLFINNTDGTFTDQAAAWGVDASHVGMGVGTGDFNNDGWIDVYVTSWGPHYLDLGPGHHKLYRNNGDGTFTDIAESAGVKTTSPTKYHAFGASWLDYDNDGDLDLAVPGWAEDSNGTKLFRNNGDETFTDATAEVLGPDMDECHAFLMRCIDMDLDNRRDMYWVGDFGSSRYYKNNGDNTYTDWTAQAGVGQEQWGMGGDVGDVNGDGLPEIYTSSIWNQNGLATGNKLYINQGDHTFDEVAKDVGVDNGGWGWATIMADLDNDGDIDLGAASGRGENTPAESNDPLRVWLNDGNGSSFTAIPAMPEIDHLWSGRGICTLDYDQDGDIDLLLLTGQGQPYLCRNESQSGNWLAVSLEGSPVPNGIGARVVAHTGQIVRCRWVTADNNFVSQNETVAHFGLADAPVVDELTVEWPNGQVTVVHDVPVNTRITLEPPACLADMNQDDQLNILDFVTFQALFQAGCQEGIGHDRRDRRK